jgi:hypothetical protein
MVRVWCFDGSRIFDYLRITLFIHVHSCSLRDLAFQKMLHERPKRVFPQTLVGVIGCDLL